MPKNIQRHSKLLVVSDTGMFQKNGKTFAFGPVVKELNEMLTLFESITWIGFNRIDQFQNASYVEVSNLKIKTILLKRIGGKSVLDKLNIVVNYPKMWSIIKSEINNHNFIHCRAPSNPAYIAMLLSKKYLNKQFWFKYAGNWTGKTSYFYNFQRTQLKKLNTNCKITVNGEWENQPENVLAFENPCLTEKDRIIGKKIINHKNLKNKNDYCFVGGLNKNKGIYKLLMAFKEIDSSRIDTLHIVGDGLLKSELEKMAKTIKINVKFYGSLPKNEVHQIYSKSHFIVLPSQNEGFPKVIGEAMNFGCIPIVSEISCINQYIDNDYNGFLINPVTVESLIKSIQQSIEIPNIKFVKYIAINYRLAEKFTFSYFLKRIFKDIF